MSLRETPRRAIREKWPLEFDLIGVPRDRAERERLLRGNDMAQNNFGDRVIDLSNPPKNPYVHQEYPKLLYKLDAKPRSVKSDAEEAEAIADGWSVKPQTAAEPVAPSVSVPVESYQDTDISDETGADSSFRPIRSKKK